MVSRIFCPIGLLVSLIAFIAVIGVPFDLRSQCVFAGLLFGLSLLIGRYRNERVLFILIPITLVISTRYLWWRATHTLAFTDPWSAVAGYTLFAAELYAYLVLILGYLQSIRPLRRKPVILPADTRSWPTVDVFIPTFNEPLHVVSATVAAAANLEWPREKLTIYLLDDGNRPEFRRYAAETGISYRARTSNIGAKAGNLNEALKHSNGELIAVFDSDQVPVRSFLQMTVGWFIKDLNIAQLQTPQYFYTPDPLEKNLSIEDKVPNESSLFYGLIQDGNDLWNATYFCGSCAVLRRSALLEVGGIAEDTVTEDAHTAIKLHRRGYDSAYINEVQSAGMATDTLAAHVNQRIRWARGLTQIFRIDNPLLGRGLSLWQRLCYTNATIHFFYAAPRLIFLLAPLCFLFFDLSVIQADAAMVAAMALPHILQNNLTAARMSGHWRHAFWAEIYETVLSFYIFMPVLVALIFPKRGKFNVTEKGHANDSTYFNYRLARPFIIIGLLNVTAISVGLYRYFVLQSAEPSTTYLNVFWAAYNLVITGAAIAVALEKRQTRKFQRHDMSLSASVSTRSGRRVSVRTSNLSESGASVVFDQPVQFAEADGFDTPERLTLSGEFGLVSLPIKANFTSGKSLRLEFAELDFTTHRKLIKLLYSSGDRWVGVREKFRSAGLLRSVGLVIYMGMTGWWRVLTGFGRSRGRATGQPASIGKSVSLLWLSGVVGLCVYAFLHSSPAMAEEEMVYELRDLTDQLETETDIGLIHYGLEVPFAIRRDTVVNSGELILDMSWQDDDQSRDEDLAIWVNNRVLWRASENEYEQGDIRIPFDGSLLTDYNVLKIALENTRDGQCRIESGSSFPLVLHDGSEIRMDVSTIPLANDLQTLPLPFFDERDPRRANIEFVLPENASDATLIAAGRASAWFGNLASYRSMEFKVITGHLPRGNAVVVASAQDLPASLQWLDAGEARVLVMDNPVFPDAQLLVLTAPSDDQLYIAVNRMLSVAGEQLAGTGTVTTLDVVGVNTPVAIGSLQGVNNASLSIADNDFSPIKVPFRVPGDFHPGDGKAHKLSLKYRYSPDFPQFREKMFVSLNGRGLLALDLERDSKSSPMELVSSPAASSGSFEGRVEIAIPHEYIGVANRLEVRFSAPSSVTDHCDGAYAASVDAGIGGDSTLDLTNGAIRARYPDLAMFVNSGLPFTSQADLATTHIQLPEQSEAQHYALYLSLMGRLSAITGIDPVAVSVSRGAGPSTRTHRIVIARPDGALEVNRLMTNTPLYLSGNGLGADFTNGVNLYKAVSDWVNPLAVEKQLSTLRERHDPENDAYIVSSRLPGNSAGVLLALVAESPAATDELQSIMTEPVRLAQVHGSAVVATSVGTESIGVGRDFSYGKLPFVQSVWWWLRENLPAMLLIVILSSVVFSVSLSGVLDRVAQRRLDVQG